MATVEPLLAQQGTQNEAVQLTQKLDERGKRAADSLLRKQLDVTVTEYKPGNLVGQVCSYRSVAIPNYHRLDIEVLQSAAGTVGRRASWVSTPTRQFRVVSEPGRGWVIETSRPQPVPDAINRLFQSDDGNFHLALAGCTQFPPKSCVPRDVGHVVWRGERRTALKLDLKWGSDPSRWPATTVFLDPAGEQRVVGELIDYKTYRVSSKGQDVCEEVVRSGSATGSDGLLPRTVTKYGGSSADGPMTLRRKVTVEKLSPASPALDEFALSAFGLPDPDGHTEVKTRIPLAAYLLCGGVLLAVAAVLFVRAARHGHRR